jgi:hypothetical protein
MSISEQAAHHQRVDDLCPSAFPGAAGAARRAGRSRTRQGSQAIQVRGERQAACQYRRHRAEANPAGPDAAALSPGRHAGQGSNPLVSRKVFQRAVSAVFPLRPRRKDHRLCLGQRQQDIADLRRSHRRLCGILRHAGARKSTRRLARPARAMRSARRPATDRRNDRRGVGWAKARFAPCPPYRRHRHSGARLLARARNP